MTNNNMRYMECDDSKQVKQVKGEKERKEVK